MNTSDGAVIRLIAASDEHDWRKLWTAYLSFYDSSVSDDVYRTTFARLLSGDPAMPNGLIAEKDGRSVGLAHYIIHPHCWRIDPVCYLQDLYADPEVRGQGFGRALIEAVYAAADHAGAPTVYWLTQDFNHTARRLYDRMA
ncbi:MAG: GNAT family N-acetyltransferase, partial [Planctomycetota bacterium]